MGKKRYAMTLVRKTFGKTVKYSLNLINNGPTDQTKACVNTYLKQVTYPEDVDQSEAFDLLIQELVNYHQNIIDQNQKEIQILKSLNMNQIMNDF